MKLLHAIRQLSIKELAYLVINSHTEEEYDYDYEDELVPCGVRRFYTTTDGNDFDGLEDAYEHQIELFNLNVDPAEFLPDSMIFGFWKLELQKAIMLGANVDADIADGIVHAFIERMRRFEEEDWKNARSQ